MQLANKYRPKLLEDVVGQDTIVQTLSNAMKSNNLHTAYLFVGQFGSGKCVTDNTYVCTPDGICRINDIFDNEDDGEYEKSVSVYNGLVKDYRPTAYLYTRKVDKTVYFNTEEGFDLEGTPEHPVLVFSQESLRPEWKEIKDLNIGDYICIGRNPIGFGESLDAKLVYVLAALTSEGHYDQNKEYFVFTNSDKKSVDHFIDCIKDLFNYECSVSADKRNNCYSVRACNSFVTKNLLDCGLSKSLSDEKEIPKIILKSDCESRSLFLGYYLQFDGSFSNGTVEYCTKSSSLAKQLQLLLLSNGIISSMKPMMKSATNGKNIQRLYYRVNVWPTEIALMKEMFSWNLKTASIPKVADIFSFDFSKNNPNKNVIPFVKQSFINIKSALPISANGEFIIGGKSIGRFKSPENCVASNDSDCTYKKLSEIIEYCAKIASFVDSKLNTISDSEVNSKWSWLRNLKNFVNLSNCLLEDNWFFSRVSEIRHVPLEKRVYDVNIPHYHSFWTSGITSHNTTTARILAAMENCEVSPGLHPCGSCKICSAIFDGSHTDVEEIDAASGAGKVDQVRKLREAALYNPIAGAKTKIFILDECHRCSPEANDALLKLIEEPPPRVRFILCTTDPRKVLPTIHSRCQKHEFKKISWALMSDHLERVAKKENVNCDKGSLNLCAKLASGSMRSALQNLDKLIDFANKKDITLDDAQKLFAQSSETSFYDLIDEVIGTENSKPDATKGFRVINSMLNTGSEFSFVYENLVEHLRMLMVGMTASKAGEFLSFSEEGKRRLQSQLTLIKQSQKLNAVLESVRCLHEAKRSFDLNIPAETALQTWLVESIFAFRR